MPPRFTEFKDTAVIVYPSKWPVDQIDAHCTIAFFPNVVDVSYTAEDILNVIDTFSWPDTIMAATAPMEMFGPDHDIPVVPLIHKGLHTNHELLVNALRAVGIEPDNTFPIYKPHVSVDNPDIEVPTFISLKKPQLWWRDTHYAI